MATLATVDTYTDVLTKAAYKVGETSVDTSPQRIAWLKEALQDIYNRRRWTWSLTTAPPQVINTSLLVNNLYTINLPVDYTEDAMYELKITDPVTKNDYFFQPIFEWQMNNFTNTTGTPALYFVRGNRADGFTATILSLTATNNGWSINVKYTKMVTDFQSLTDGVPLPDSMALVLGIAKEIFRSQNRLDQYELTRQEYEAAIDELSDTDVELERALMLNLRSWQEYVGVPSDARHIYELG
jgi:hypothetical protein